MSDIPKEYRDLAKNSSKTEPGIVRKFLKNVADNVESFTDKNVFHDTSSETPDSSNDTQKQSTQESIENKSKHSQPPKNVSPSIDKKESFVKGETFEKGNNFAKISKAARFGSGLVSALLTGTPLAPTVMADEDEMLRENKRFWNEVDKYGGLKGWLEHSKQQREEAIYIQNRINQTLSGRDGASIQIPNMGHISGATTTFMDSPVSSHDAAQSVYA